MKKFLLLLIVMMLNLNVRANDDNYYEKLIYAIAHVESSHNPKAVSPSGKHVGYLQISKGCVDECNKLLNAKKYTYKDRYDKQKSIEMFYIIQQHYNPNGDIHLALRIWNEGTSVVGRKYRMTSYMKRVLRVYDKIK